MEDCDTTLQEKRLRRTVELCASAHPYFRRKFREWGLEARDILSLEDLSRIPITQKNDYMADPDSFCLRPKDCSLVVSKEESVLWDVVYTTGTTAGVPTPFYNTTHDMYAILEQARRCAEAEGIRSEDRIANLYPLAGFPTGAFQSVIRTSNICGIPMVSGLTGTSESEFSVRHSLKEALGIVGRFNPTVLWGVPSFIRRFLYEANSQRSNLSNVRLIITSGESVSENLRSEFKDRIQTLGGKSPEVLSRYAFTEMSGGFVQCEEGISPQNLIPDLYYFEVVDEETGNNVSSGESGLLVITHLHRRGTVLLRYAAGDIVTLSTEPCPSCGRMGERITSTPRRVGGLVKCRGMLVNTNLIVETISSIQGIGEFQVVFSCMDNPGAMDELIIRAELDNMAFGEMEIGGQERFQAEIGYRVKEAVSIRPNVEFVARGVLYDETRSIKATRVLDLRTQAND